MTIDRIITADLKNNNWKIFRAAPFRMAKRALPGLLAIAIIAGTTGAAGKRLYDNYLRDDPETYIGFDMKGYKPIDCALPTKGDVIRVKMLNNLNYKKRNIGKGMIELEGFFEYSIRPEARFMPNTEDHTDFHGRTPFDGKAYDNYWTDTRHGRVMLAPDTK